MPITEKDVLTVIGNEDLSKFEKVEDFKADFEKRFVAKDRLHEDTELMSSLAGKISGPYETAVKKHFKEYGVDFEANELKDKKIPEITKLALDKLIIPMREELETLKSASGGDESLKKALEKEKADALKYKNESLQFKELNASLTGEIDNLKGGFETEKKNWTINHLKKELFGQIKYKTAGVPESTLPLIKNGFESELNSNFKFDLDDNQKLVILNADGKRVEDPKTSGKVLDPFSAVKDFAVKKMIWEDNPNAGKTQQKHVPDVQSRSNQRPQREARQPMRG